jgi:hypothetical protein
MKKKHAKLKPGYCYELDTDIDTRHWRKCKDECYGIEMRDNSDYEGAVYIGTRVIDDIIAAVFLCNDGAIRAQTITTVLNNAS